MPRYFCHGLAIVLLVPASLLLAQDAAPSLRADIETILQCAKDGTSSESWMREHAPGRLLAWQAAANAGDVEGEFMVGKCYDFGTGVAKSDQSALEWFRRGAEKGFAPAENNLGSFFKLGRGVAPSPTEATKWHRKAAEQGYGLAQYNLGLAYFDGVGVEKDPRMAAEWFQKGADQGFAQARYGLAICLKNGTGVEQDRVKAAKLYREAAAQGLFAAQRDLGYFYSHGLFTFPRAYEQAAFWSRKSADMGDPKGRVILGSLYFTGHGLPKDERRAVEWFEKAAQQGHPAATHLLQWMRGDRNAPPPPIQANDSVYRRAVRSTVWLIVEDGSGTGALIDEQRKLVVTAWHCVRNVTDVTICFPQFDTSGQLIAERDKYDERELILGTPGKVIAKNPSRDLAIIQLPSEAVLPPNTPPLNLASGTPEPGSQVHLIGNPGVSGALFNYASGQVRAAYRRRWTNSPSPSSKLVFPFEAKVIETNTLAFPGNSGGPLLNDRSELVGISHGGNGQVHATDPLADFIDVSEVKFVLDEMQKAAQIPANATDDRWLNDIVFPKYGELALRYGSDVVGKMAFDARVITDTKDWIEVRHNTGNGVPLVRKPEYKPYLGWVAKSEVVRLRDAERHFTTRIDANPNDAEAYALRGYVRQLKNENDLAIKDLSEAVRLKPTAWTYGQRGTVYNRMRQADHALSDLTESIRLDPTKAIVFNNRGFAWQTKKEWDKAITDYGEAIRLDPRVPASYTNRGESWFYGKKEYDKAIADYDEAIRLDPKHAYAYIARGIARHSGKLDHDHAIADFDEALRLNTPKAAYAQISRGHAWLYGKKDYDRALADYDGTISLNPKDGYAYLHRAMAWTHKGDWTSAFADAESGVVADPRNSTALALKATLLVSAPDEKRRDSAAAQRLAEQAQEIAKGIEDEPWAALAAVHAERGEWPDAVSCQSKAIELTTPARKAEHERRNQRYAEKMPLRLPEP